MTVNDVMTRLVHPCSASDPMSRAAQIMWEQDCGVVPVVGKNNEVLGMITDRDLCMAACMQNRPLSQMVVSSAMSRRVYSCGPEDSLATAEQVMRRHQVRRLPVLGLGGQLLGLLSLSDVVRALAEKRREQGLGRRPSLVEATFEALSKPRRRRRPSLASAA